MTNYKDPPTNSPAGILWPLPPEGENLFGLDRSQVAVRFEPGGHLDGITFEELKAIFIEEWEEGLSHKLYLLGRENNAFQRHCTDQIHHVACLDPSFEDARSALIMSMVTDSFDANYDYYCSLHPSLFSEDQLLDCYKRVQSHLRDRLVSLNRQAELEEKCPDGTRSGES